MTDTPPQHQISGGDLIAWIKFNKPEIYADALHAVLEAEQAVAEAANKPNRQQRRQAERKTVKKAAVKK